MENIFDLITLEVQNEHDLSHKPQFSEPKIYDANGDLNKRWYVYFSFKDTKTGRMQRIKNIYGKVERPQNQRGQILPFGPLQKTVVETLEGWL